MANHDAKTGRLDIQHVIFVEASRTGDFQMTKGLRQIVENDGNTDDLMAFMFDTASAGKLSVVPKPPVFSGIADACSEIERLARGAKRSLDAEALESS
jgi:hypothetical protein